MFVGLVRYVAHGWIDTVFVEPTFFFKYPGFEFVTVAGPGGLYALFAVTAAAALCVALGLWYRVATATFFVGFTYIQLMDVTNYLNHYVLVVLLAGLMCFMPLDRALSLRTWRTPRERRATVSAWVLYVLRFQIAVVYIFAAVAKLGPDWLWHGQPMNIWMSARSELPLIGPFIAMPEVALAMSWAGFLYDASIVPLLLWRRTRSVAYFTVLVFHAFTWLFFDIGMFPFIMTVSTTLFFAPSWPRRRLGLGTVGVAGTVSHRSMSPLATGALAIFVALQLAVPLRHFLYEGNVLWHERGMRFAWKVMVREKNGSLHYRVTEPTSGRTWVVSPHEYLDWRQANEMAAQPDMILQLARHIAWDFAQRGVPNVSVEADSLVSLNGRPPARMIDPEADLTRVDESSGDWILPAPAGPPIRLAWPSGRTAHR